MDSGRLADAPGVPATGTGFSGRAPRAPALGYSPISTSTPAAFSAAASGAGGSAFVMR